MQEIIFDESQLNNLYSVAADLFAEDTTDPRSWNYQRQLIRPKIPGVKIALFFSFLVFSFWGSYFLLTTFYSKRNAAIICSAGVVLVLCIFLKPIIITFVKLYQRYAPATLRNKCRFEPSCSEYMILSLQKYGLWKGLRKGINRLKRCNIGDGGFDFP